MNTTTELSLSYFKNLGDVEPKQLDFKSWAAFTKFLDRLSERKLNGKKDAELICPAIYPRGKTRANRNVVHWAGWTAVDVDSFEGDIDVFLNRFSDWDYYVYSTASSTIEHPKFRLVFRLGRYVEADEIRSFWFSLQSYIDDQGDKQCKDLSRMYYTPAQYVGAYNFIKFNSGRPLDVDLLLAEYPMLERKTSLIERLPEEYQKKVSSYRKEKLDVNFTWTSYHDCPFVNQKLVKEYENIAFTDGTGRYAMIYKIMTSIASLAIKKKYPITTNEIVSLVREIDLNNSNLYENRPLETEAKRAIDYAYRNA
jgi:hypothetical protein